MAAPTVDIGVCFGKMKALNEGLGEYGMQFGEHLAKRSGDLAQQRRIRLHFRLPKELHGAFGDAVDYLHQLPLQRHLSLHAHRFALWHILHQHNPYRRPWLSRRCLVTVHDLNHRYGNDLKFRAKAERRLARIAAGADAFVAISQHTKRDLEAALGTAKPITVVHNGVRDLTATRPERPGALPADIAAGGFFFHISRMAASKNVESLLRLMQLLPQHRLVLAGPRSGESLGVQAQVAAMKLANVHVLFDVSQAEKVWLYANCRAFMFPSLAEGFGLPPIEAMQFGKPVFLSDLTSLPEVGGPQASYWRDFDPAAMRDVVLERLNRSEGAVAEDARRTLQWAAQFSWARCVDGYLAVYQQMLGQA